MKPTPEMQAIAEQIVQLQGQYLRLEDQARRKQFRDYVKLARQRAEQNYLRIRR
ncbi:TPA: hypothetical protein SL772_006390 [Pseudomonas aeruginosa]|nr:hypothetical protein [Pseudomonas aeruginosa]